MASGPRLIHFALLACEFQITAKSEGDSDDAVARADTQSVPDDPDPGTEIGGEPAGEGAVEGELDVDGLVALNYTVTEDAGLLVLVLRSVLTDPSMPYEMAVITGSRFTPPDPPVPLDAAAATLVFVTYPYVREIFMNISARSPYQPYYLPPLTTLPHPRVTGQPSEEEAPADPGE